MDALQYAEDRGGKTIAVLSQAYDDLHERAYKLATVLVAGGGAAGAFALGKLGAEGSSPIAWAPVGALALSWFGTAAVLIWRGATSRDLSPGVGAGVFIGYFDDRLAERGDGAEAEALEITRREAIRLDQLRVEAYQKACIARAQSIDAAYKMATACTPLVPLIAAGACVLLRP